MHNGFEAAASAHPQSEDEDLMDSGESDEDAGGPQGRPEVDPFTVTVEMAPPGKRTSDEPEMARPKRQRHRPKNFNPSVDGANDTRLKQNQKAQKKDQSQQVKKKG